MKTDTVLEIEKVLRKSDVLGSKLIVTETADLITFTVVSTTLDFYMLKEVEKVIIKFGVGPKSYKLDWKTPEEAMKFEPLEIKSINFFIFEREKQKLKGLAEVLKRCHPNHTPLEITVEALICYVNECYELRRIVQNGSIKADSPNDAS